MAKRFTRNIEDFTCINCGFKVRGTGYTDHCPKCLWGKHVDVNPGDRASDCGGMLEPIKTESNRKDIVIIYKCKKCGATKKNNSAAEDDKDLLFKLL
ncbi:MAG: RNHCP domain-containing protein [Candidatus Micrarchaeales archaeon]